MEHIWHSEGWTLRNEALLEAVLKQGRTTRHPWLIACDAKMCPEDFQTRADARGGPKRSTCRSKGPKEEWIERTYDYVVASGSLKGKILQMEVVEDFESRPHKAVSFVVESEKEIKEWSDQKLPKVLPGYSGGRLPGRSTTEKCRGEGAVDEDGEEREVRSQIAQKVVACIKEKVSEHSGGKEAVQRPAGQSVMRSWDCSQIENEEGEESWREGDQIAAGMRSKDWRRSWNEGGWKEAPCSWRSCERYRSWWCRNACHKAKW